MSSSFVCLYVFVFFLNWKQPKKTKPWTLYFQRTNMKTHNFVSNPIWKWRWTHLCQPFGLQTCLWKNCWWEVIYVSHLAFKHAFDKIVDGRSVEDLNWPPIIGSPMANVCTFCLEVMLTCLKDIGWKWIGHFWFLSPCLSFYVWIFCSKKLGFSTFCSWYLVMASNRAMAQRSTPYFSVRENVEICQLQERERTPRAFNSGRIVEESSRRIVDKSSGKVMKEAPIVSILFQSLEDTSVAAWEKLKIKMDFCSPYKEDDLDRWTNATKFKIWKTAQSEWTTVEDPKNQLAVGNGTTPPLNAAVFSTTTIWFWPGWIWTVWIVLENFLRRWIWFSILVQMIVVSSGKHGHEKKMFWSSIKSGNLMEKINLRTAAVLFALFARIRSTVLNNFLRLEQCCPVCKEPRVIHAVFVCDGTRKSVGALLGSIMLFGHCDLSTVFSGLLNLKKFGTCHL